MEKKKTSLPPEKEVEVRLECVKNAVALSLPGTKIDGVLEIATRLQEFVLG